MTPPKTVKPVRLTAAVLGRPPEEAVATRAAAKAPPPGQRLTLTFENPGDQPLRIWANTRSLAYSAGDGVLTLYLTEETPVPPDIIMISKHPRTPRQVVVAGHGKTSFDIVLPQTIRRRVEGAGLGMHFVEEPIGDVQRVEVHVQYATEAITLGKDETSEAFATRLRRQGSVEHTAITTSKE